jgi:hypothetical protein
MPIRHAVIDQSKQKKPQPSVSRASDRPHVIYCSVKYGSATIRELTYDESKMW